MGDRVPVTGDSVRPNRSSCFTFPKIESRKAQIYDLKWWLIRPNGIAINRPIETPHVRLVANTSLSLSGTFSTLCILQRMADKERKNYLFVARFTKYLTTVLRLSCHSYHRLSTTYEERKAFLRYDSPAMLPDRRR